MPPPLNPGKEHIGENIKTEESEGKSEKQSLAIALSVAGVGKKKKKKRARKKISNILSEGNGENGK